MRTEKKEKIRGSRKKTGLYILLGILAAAALICLLLFLTGSMDQNAGDGMADLPDASQTEEPGDAEDPDTAIDSDSEQPEESGGTGSAADPSGTGVRTEDDGSLMVLVNKQHAVSSDYYPVDMVDVDGSLSTNQGLKVKREAYDAYLKMLEAAKQEGLSFSMCSAYRSYETQKSLYDNSLAINGKAYTEKMFAYPGQSEHHTGYAIDVTSASMNWGLSQNYTDYPDGAWITAHCSEYGFIIRYPKGKEDITGYMYEPWHIRYVGIDAAKEITEQGITLEEYLGAV